MEIAGRQYEFMKTLHRPWEPQDWENMSYIELRRGNLQRAKVYNDSLVKYRPDKMWITCKIYQQEGNYKEAFNVRGDMITDMNKSYADKVNSPVLEIVRDYFTLQEEQVKFQREKEWQAMYGIFVICLIIVGFLLYIYFRRVISYRSKMDSYMLSIQDL